LTIVAPITSIKAGAKKYPIEVWVTPKESGLPIPSKVCLSQIRTVNKQRWIRKVGMLTSKKMAQVDEAIRVSLDVP
jgi:mRNA interferase MazF